LNLKKKIIIDITGTEAVSLVTFLDTPEPAGKIGLMRQPLSKKSKEIKNLSP